MVTGNDAGCRLEPRPASCVLEFIAYQWPALRELGADWPSAAGALRLDAAKRPELMHFAPGRWLAPEPTSAVAAMLNSAAAGAAGTLVDVTGKWEAMVICGAGAARLLASTIDVDAILKDRGCAAATLFDCPAILAAPGADFALWVQASYSADFIATVQRLQSTLWPGY